MIPAHTANLRYQDALDWRKWTKGGWDFPFCPRGFEKAVMENRSISSKPTCWWARPNRAARRLENRLDSDDATVSLSTVRRLSP